MPQRNASLNGKVSDSSDGCDGEGTSTYAVRALEGLVRKIADGQAIIYVGAGVSQSAGLPSWNELLAKLQKEATNRLKNQPNVARNFFEGLKKRSRNLELGDWLLRLLGPEFQQVISSSLSDGENLCKTEPSSIHWNIMRSPFRMAITTNYDLLLERAYAETYHACPVTLPYLTWKHTDEILRAGTGKSFRIVHAHGTVGDSNSIVLSGSQYTMLHNARPRFEDVIKQFLKNYTFLFVGTALEDPDLIYILQEAIAENAGVVGPHYALLPYKEAPQIRREILRESLHIEVIPIGSKELVKEWEEKQSSEGSSGKGTYWMTAAVSSMLRALAGTVALRRFRRDIPGSPTSDDPTFCLDVALAALLRQAIEATGSFRGDICLSPDGIDSHLSGVLQYEYSEGATTGEVIHRNVHPSSVCGIAYHEADTRVGVYIKDVTSRNLAAQIANSGLTHYGEVRYVSGDSRVRSELALPIEADGVRVGVLNLESNLIAAYGEDGTETRNFLHVARSFAEKAGRLYAAAHDRDRRSARLEAVNGSEVYRQLREIQRELWHLARGRMPPTEGRDAAEHLEFLAYRARYRTGELISQNPTETILKGKWAADGGPRVGEQRFPFSGMKEQEKDRYLATRVFLDGRPYYYPNVCKAIKEGKIHNRYSKTLGLSLRVDNHGMVQPKQECPRPEPIIGFPVLIHGHVAGVVVAWHFLKEPEDTEELDSRDIELFRRATHLMANYFDWRKRRDDAGAGVGQSTLQPEAAHDTENPNAARENVESRTEARRVPTEFPSIGIVREVLSCITKGKIEDLDRSDDSLDAAGRCYRRQIGPAVLGFLRLLGRQESAFRERNSDRPTDWISPLRCRCWVRARPSAAKESSPKAGARTVDNSKMQQSPGSDRENDPIFTLAFELNIGEGGHQIWRNRFPRSVGMARASEQRDPLNVKAQDPTIGIMMKPLPRLSSLDAAASMNRPRPRDIVLSPTARPEKIIYWAPASGKPATLECQQTPESLFEVFENNLHLSFLLSRISVYPYAFRQMPRVIGTDIMVEALDKNPDLPWFVAPLIVGRQDRWEDDGANDCPQEVDSEKNLAGYLTFDDGPGYSKWKDALKEESSQTVGRVEMKDDWVKVQNDMLHQITLFAACLAQQPCLRNLVEPARGETRP
jgi:hypothetical protein